MGYHHHLNIKPTIKVTGQPKAPRDLSLGYAAFTEWSKESAGNKIGDVSSPTRADLRFDCKDIGDVPSLTPKESGSDVTDLKDSNNLIALDPNNLIALDPALLYHTNFSQL